MQGSNSQPSEWGNIATYRLSRSLTPHVTVPKRTTPMLVQGSTSELGTCDSHFSTISHAIINQLSTNSQFPDQICTGTGSPFSHIFLLTNNTDIVLDLQYYLKAYLIENWELLLWAVSTWSTLSKWAICVVSFVLDSFWTLTLMVNFVFPPRPGLLLL